MTADAMGGQPRARVRSDDARVGRAGAHARVIAAMLAAALLVAGCFLSPNEHDYPTPPRPPRTLHAEIQGVVTDAQKTGCHRYRFTLDSGATVDLVQAGGCAATPAGTFTPFLRTANFITEEGAFEGGYLYVGRFPESGTMWFFSVQKGGWPDGCLYFLGAGAYDEGANFHLSNGLVVPKAADLRYTSLQTMTDAEKASELPKAVVCANAKGEIDLVAYQLRGGM
jgi:hypothetical protein